MKPLVVALPRAVLVSRAGGELERATSCTMVPITALRSLRAAAEAEAGAPRGVGVADWSGICRVAARIDAVGEVPGPFSGAWLLEQHEVVFNALLDGSKEVEAAADAFFRVPRGPVAGDLRGGSGDGLVGDGAPRDA